MRKIVATIALIGALLPLVPMGPAKKVQAAVPVIEGNPAVLGPLAAIAGLNTSIFGQDIFEWAQTFVLATLKKQILDVIVDQIITYIQGGGKPQFVTDWRGFLEDAGQAAVGELAQELGLGFLCSPFSFQIRLYLLPVPKFSQQAQCTLNQIVSNINAFYSDFRNGGWIALGEGWQPQNNFFGALLLSTHEAERRRGLAESAAYNEAVSGGGYLSGKDKQGNINTPGSTISSLTAKAVGSDIDYVLSAEQLADYASAIASAIFNRVLKEGIARVQKSGSSADDDLYVDTTASNFEFLKSSVLGQIGETLLPRLEARDVIDDTIRALEEYKTKLNKLKNDFTATGRSVCQGFQQPNVDVAQVKSEIDAETVKADGDISKLNADRSENQQVIDRLEAASAEINQLVDNSNQNYTRLTQINNELIPVLDPADAIAFKGAVQDLSATLNQNISDQLAKFNQQLTQCQATP